MQKQFKNLLKGILIYGFGNVSIKLVGLVLMRLYTNPKYLSVDDYAAFVMLEVTSLVIVSLFSFTLYNAYLRWYWDKEYIDKRKSMLFSCYAILFATGVIISFSGYFSSRFLSMLLFSGKDTFALPISIMIIGSSVQLLIDLTLSQIRVDGKPTFYISSNIIRLTISMAATVYLLMYTSRGVLGIQEAMLLGNITFLVFTFPYILKQIDVKFNIPIIKEMLRYSLPLTIGSLSQVLLAQLDRYVLNFKTDSLSVGLYSTGYKIANTTKFFIVNSIQIALVPTLFKLMNHPDHRAIYARIMTWFTIVVVYSSLFISLFGLEITKLLSTGTIYWDAYKIIPILSLGIVFGMLKDSSVMGLHITKRTSIIGTILVGIALLDLVLNLLLIPFLGVYGGAISSLLSQIIYFIIINSFAQKYYHIPYRYDRVIIIIIIGGVLYIAGNLFNSYSLEIRMLTKFIALTFFPLLLFVFKVFDKSEIVAFKSFIINFRNLFNNPSTKDVDEQLPKVEGTE